MNLISAKRALAALVLIALLLPAMALAAVTPLPIDLSGGVMPKAEGYTSEWTYEDESISVAIESCLWGETECYIARVKIADPSQLRTAPAYSFERNQTAMVDAMAERVNAVLAINGDYFSFQKQRGGYLVRQGEEYMNKPIKGRDVLIIDGNGDFTIEKVVNDEVIEKHAAAGVVNAFNFGPGLVIDGEVLTEYGAKYNSAQNRSQRCAIAQVKRGTMEYLAICCEGPVETDDGGMTMVEFAEFVSTFGVENAYNLDGGYSTAMIFNGEKVNAVDNKKLRPVSDIVYFASAASEE